jgi:hypothetical protein
MNMRDKMPCGYGTLRITAVSLQHQVSCSSAQRSQQQALSPADLGRDPNPLNIGQFYNEHLEMLL